MDEGKNPFFAVRRSSVESSPNPAHSDLGLVVRVAAPLDRRPTGDRKPARHQLDSRTQPYNRSSAGVIGPWADQIEPKRVNDLLAD